ncbi:THO complex subunit 6 homolog [Liolophura sinensis]|uniref:THO complex subunit 6 homolog n=1 Tax=Liolophura sinensis TaxID=3198878 RepID=UPI0031592E1F
MGEQIQDHQKKACELYYTNVYAQSFSPCGKYLAAGNNYGQIAVFSIVAALSPDATKASWTPVFSFKAQEDSVFSMVSTDTLLICAGSAGQVLAWKWADILNKAPKVVWSLSVPRGNSFTEPEINSLVLSSEDGVTRLYAGCGDNNVYIWDMESGTLLSQLKGHEDYIHCVCVKGEGLESQCVSASEDGTIRLWDIRAGREATHVIEPYKNELCARPEFGRWLGCVAVDPSADWLICGGGPKLSAWHLRSLSSTTVFDTPGACQQHVMFYEDTIISGGSEPRINHWFVNGDVKAQVPCRPTSVFNIVINTESQNHKVLSVAGCSPKLDVCTNFGYTAFSLTFAST